MIPFVRTVNELTQTLKIIEDEGLKQSDDFKIWMMVEIPSNVILLDKFLATGIDGVSIGSNDLTQLTLGVDRDSAKLADTFDERDEAVLMSLEKIISTAKSMGVTSSICGQAPSVYPELTEKLVEKSNKITFLLGAKTKNELFFVDRLRMVLSNGKADLSITTEDGSYGVKGLVTDQIEPILKRKDFAMMYVCGPEPMMAKLFTLAEKYGVPMQASIERIMRCAIGLCGSCAMGKYRVCHDGPVLTSEQLREVKHEFGVFTLGFNGKVIKF